MNVRCQSLLLLGMAPLASYGAPVDSAQVFELSEPWEHVTIGQLGAEPGIIVYGRSGARALSSDGRPREQLTSSPISAVTVGEQGELLLCGSDGLVRWDATPAQLDDAPCVGVVPGLRPGSYLVVRSDGSVAATDTGAQVIPPGALRPPVLVAQLPERKALASLGGTFFYEVAREGVSQIATGSPIGGLTGTDRGWAWSLPGLDGLSFLSREVLPLDGRPSTLKSARLGGNQTLVIAQPEVPAITLRDGPSEARFFLPDRPIDLAVGDLTGDGCDDVLVLTAPGQRLVRHDGRCRTDTPAGAEAPTVSQISSSEALPLALPATPEPKTTEPPTPRLEPPTLLGVDFAPFVGRGHGSPHLSTLVGSGVAVGGGLNERLIIPVFASGVAGVEYGGNTLRLYAGLDSVPLFIWMAEGEGGGGIQLINATVGPVFGGRQLAAGPFVTAGLLNLGAGWRTVWTPFRQSPSSTFGLEARLTWFAPTIGQVNVLAVWRIDPHQATRAASDPPRGLCRRFGLSAGVSGTVFATSASWEYVGSTAQRDVDGSPWLGLSCDVGSRAFALGIGMETALLASYLADNGDRRHHLASVTFSPLIGSDAFRLGPAATAGIWRVGLGGRLVLTPIQDARGTRHGIELRAFRLFASSSAWQGSIGYTGFIDPRGRTSPTSGSPASGTN